jgi:hypothetical protein
MVPAQQFWLTTNEFWGGPKTGITSIQDSILIIGTTKGVMKSTNECEQIQQVLIASEIHTVYGTKSKQLLAGGTGKVFISNDLGANWDSVLINSVYPIIQFIENSSGELYAITNDYDKGDGVFYSGDRGLTWEKRNNGLGSHLACSKIAIDRFDRLYLTLFDGQNVGFGGLFISDNKGLLWEKAPVSIDSLSNPIRIGITTGLSILPNDSVYLSFYGLASNYMIQLNIYKNIADIKVNNSWEVLRLMNYQNWWEDVVLNDIKVARNGDWFSSLSGNINHGGTAFSKDGKNWNILDYGLGTDTSGIRNEQFITELDSGKVFMIQMLDERIYKTSKNIWTNTPKYVETQPGISIYPNPVSKNEHFTLQINQCSNTAEISVYDISGNSLFYRRTNATKTIIPTPGKKGIYILTVKVENLKKSLKIIVN